MIRIRMLEALLLAFVGLSVAGPTSAQIYPSHPITIVVPFAPGGATDVLPRMLGERLRASLGQPVIIENVSGAGGTIGLGRARSARRLYSRERQLEHVCFQRRDLHVAV